MAKDHVDRRSVVGKTARRQLRRPPSSYLAFRSRLFLAYYSAFTSRLVSNKSSLSYTLMATTLGTHHAPIVISDDEDEAIFVSRGSRRTRKHVPASPSRWASNPGGTEQAVYEQGGRQSAHSPAKKKPKPSKKRSLESRLRGQSLEVKQQTGVLTA